MSLFAITREAGPALDRRKGRLRAPAVNDHAAFMNRLAEEGFVLFAGPLAGSENDRIRVLLIADADNEAAPSTTASRPTLGRKHNGSSPKASSRGTSSSAPTESRIA